MSNSTLKSIAKSTGFSVTTVSRALSGYDDVSASTRELILAEAERQNYQPNLQARNLKGQKSQTLGMVIPTSEPRSFDDPFFSAFIAGIGNRAVQDDFYLLVGSHPPGDDSELDAYKRMISGHNVDGMILVRVREQDPRIDFLQEQDVPFVVYGRARAGNDFVHIDIDGEQAQYHLTLHLIELGHRDIAFIAPPQHLSFSTHRVRGFKRALADANLTAAPNHLIHAETMTEEAGREITLGLLASEHTPSAVMGGNDRLALGVMAAVQQRGKQVGEDVAVAGFDDIPAAAHVYPGLTTMHQPVYAIGEQLTDKLLGTIAGSPPENPATILTADLIVRGSTVPNRPGATSGN